MYESYPVTAQPAGERFAYFQAIVDRLFCPMQVAPQYPSWQPFACTLETSRLGSIRLARVAASACAVRRRPEDIAKADTAYYLVKFQLKGESHWSQRNRGTHLRPGDFVVCSTSEPYLLQFRDSFDMPVLALSVDTMRRLTRDPDQFLGIRMDGTDADCGLLSSFVAQTVARMSRLPESMLARVEANMLDLLGAVLGARARNETTSAEQQISQIKEFIARHLHNHRLGPAMIAAAFGTSTRHVHAIFETEPLTISRYIRSVRAHECRRALESSPLEGTLLTDMALKWGFYDLSHMTRCFRAEFGVTPGEVRAGAAAAKGSTSTQPA